MPIRVWRVLKSEHAESPLSGEGARLHGGRWNHPGTAVIYASATLALAELEMLVHLDREDAPDDLVAIELEIPSRVRIEVVEELGLPADWRTYPAPDPLADLGTEWVNEGRTVALRVPSAVIPPECNFLLNPAHRHAARIRIVGATPLALDSRLFSPRTPEPRPRTRRRRTRTRRSGR